jgi:adenosylcobinamide-GDP ribazoletransferase
MNPWPKALVTAFIFLTRLPMPVLEIIEAEDEGRSLLCFPIVGFAIGVLMWGLALCLDSYLSPLVLAAIITVFWTAVTGGLHLDGLADSADGWLGGQGNVERSLKIMHDSRCGSGALVAVTSLLILKFAALTVIAQQQQWLVLVAAPIIGRSAASLLLIPGSWFYTPYVQSKSTQTKGIARNFIDHCPPIAKHTTLLAVILCGLLLTTMKSAIFVIAASALTLWLLRRLMLQRLGGVTGDTSGATTEIIEAVVLISAGVLFTAAL